VVVLAACAAAAASGKAETNAMPESRTRTSIELMEGFAARTGLTSDRPAQRYLWTDSFAVCNFLGLSRATGDEQYRRLALRLVDRVHEVLGRHRGDDPRKGWISGLDDRQAAEHPTKGGLRIGKPLPERASGEPFDEALEWDRDGQYFHYLTKWMQALDLTARSTGDPRYSRWARELAARAHAAFRYTPTGGARPRLRWKMSIDLSRPLVPSMGQHDPLDGFVTLVQLQTTPAALSTGPPLDRETAELATMVEAGDWTTSDPLGLGGLLMDAWRIHQLVGLGARFDRGLLEQVLDAARDGLADYARQNELGRPAATRLAFRELGLAIGLHAAERLQRVLDAPPAGSRSRTGVGKELEALLRHAPLAAEIERFWLSPEHRGAPSWSEHRDINEVMLATSLAPEGCLELPPVE
jgi:hypothetical protein